MLNKKFKIQLNSLEKLYQSLKEKVDIKIGRFGGRNYILESSGKSYGCKLKDLFSHALKLSLKAKKNSDFSDLRVLKYVVVALMDLDKQGNALLKKGSSCQKILTKIRQVFGNCGFYKKKIISKLHHLVIQTPQIIIPPKRSTPDEDYAFALTTTNEEKFRFLLRAANAGHAKACYKVGEIFHKGLGSAVDKGEARKYYNLAIEKGNLQGYFGLGLLEEEDKHFDQAVEYVEKGASLGNIECKLHLGKILVDYTKLRGRGNRGYPNQADKERAVQIFEELIKLEDIDPCLKGEAFYELAQCAITEKMDVQKTIWYQEAVKLGNPNAKYELATLHKFHRGGLISEPALEEKLLLEASDGKAYWADMVLGELYRDKRDRPKAIEHFKRGARLGDTHCMYHLIHLLDKNLEDCDDLIAFIETVIVSYDETGNEFFNHFPNKLRELATKKYCDKAREYYQKNASIGSLEAKYKLAEMYYWGAEIPKDRKKTYELLRDVLKIHPGYRPIYSSCHLILGQALIDGDGIEQNKEEGIELLIKAAHHGNELAPIILAEIVLKGEFRFPNLVQDALIFKRADEIEKEERYWNKFKEIGEEIWKNGDAETLFSFAQRLDGTVQLNFDLQKEDLQAAKGYYKKAAYKGHLGAQEKLEELEGED